MHSQCKVLMHKSILYNCTQRHINTISNSDMRNMKCNPTRYYQRGDLFPASLSSQIQNTPANMLMGNFPCGCKYFLKVLTFRLTSSKILHLKRYFKAKYRLDQSNYAILFLMFRTKVQLVSLVNFRHKANIS